MARRYADMALDDEGRVLRRPNWYSPEDVAVLNNEIKKLDTDVLAWQLRFSEARRALETAIKSPANPTLRCRKHLHWLLRLIVK